MKYLYATWKACEFPEARKTSTLLDTAEFTNKIEVNIYLNTKLLNFQPVNQ